MIDQKYNLQQEIKGGEGNEASEQQAVPVMPDRSHHLHLVQSRATENQGVKITIWMH